MGCLHTAEGPFPSFVLPRKRQQQFGLTSSDTTEYDWRQRPDDLGAYNVERHAWPAFEKRN